MDIERHIEPEKLHCDICDFFGFERRADGQWSFCYYKGRHFPDDIMPGQHVCLKLSVNGQSILKGDCNG